MVLNGCKAETSFTQIFFAMTTIRLSALALAVCVLASCSKKEDEPANNNGNNNNTACNGMNLCFKLDGTQETRNAKLKVLTDRYRIYWEESGTPYKNIEIDVYGTTAATYAIDSAKGNKAGKSGFQYYVAGKQNIMGTGGSIVVSSIAPDKITGTFTVDGWDPDAKTTHKITDGNFVNVAP